jgi:hypothetical protein
MHRKNTKNAPPAAEPDEKEADLMGVFNSVDIDGSGTSQCLAFIPPNL